MDGNLASSTLASRPPLQCCCGQADCAYLKHNCSALESVEKDVHTAAKLGQVSNFQLSPIGVLSARSVPLPRSMPPAPGSTTPDSAMTQSLPSGSPQPLLRYSSRSLSLRCREAASVQPPLPDFHQCQRPSGMQQRWNSESIPQTPQKWRHRMPPNQTHPPKKDTPCTDQI